MVRLRKVLGAAAIETSAARLRARRCPADEVDSQRFERQVDPGARAAHARRGRPGGVPARPRPCAVARGGLRRASRTGRRPWPRPAGWASCASRPRSCGWTPMLRAGRYREVLAEAQALVRAAPLRERRWALLARAQYQAGAAGRGAAHHPPAHGGAGRTSSGIDPAPTWSPWRRRSCGRTPRSWCPMRPAPPARPVRGRASGRTTSGRRPVLRAATRDVAACLAILRRTSVLALVGPSGSGKSSLLRAGVAAALRRRGHRTCH